MQSIIQLFCVSLHIMKQNLRKIYLICLFTLITAVVGASNDGKSFISYPGGKCYMFRVTLRDKLNRLILWINRGFSYPKLH